MILLFVLLAICLIATIALIIYPAWTNLRKIREARRELESLYLDRTDNSNLNHSLLEAIERFGTNRRDLQNALRTSQTDQQQWTTFTTTTTTTDAPTISPPADTTAILTPEEIESLNKESDKSNRCNHYNEVCPTLDCTNCNKYRPTAPEDCEWHRVGKCPESSLHPRTARGCIDCDRFILKANIPFNIERKDTRHALRKNI